MHLLRRKSRSSKGSPTSTPHRTRSNTAELDRPVSVRSTPSQPALASPRNAHREDVGNRTEPIPGSHSRHSSPSRKQLTWRQKTYLTPEINPVRAHQSKGIFSIKREETNSSDDEDILVKTEVPATENHQGDDVEGISPYPDGVPVINLPVRNGTVDSQHSQHSFQSQSRTVSRGSPRPHLLEPSPEHYEAKDKLNNIESNHSGILSTFMSAAHNAATHIGSIAGTGKHAETTNSKSQALLPGQDLFGEGKPQESMVSGGNFIQHLDSLLSFSGRKAASTTPVSQHQQEPEPLEEDVLDTVSQSSRTNAHDVKFQPLRKTLVSTMGKGELTLEDLGFADIPTNASLNGISTRAQSPHQLQQGPQIEVQEPSPRSHKLIGPLTPNTEVPPRLGSPKPSDQSLKPALETRQSSSNALHKMKSAEPPNFSRSLSPQHQKRPLSPTALAHSDSMKRRPSMSRRSQSSHGDHYALNDDISFGSPLSQISSAFELKNITFSNSKRNSDFHSVFKKIPKSERLIDDYSCALQREIMVQGRMLINERILVQGRMYISERHISFKSNILGWVTTLNIPIQEIVQLEKKNTAGLFPNAIVIQTLHQKYIFASLLARDTTFDLITNIWNQLVRGSMDGQDEAEDVGRGRSMSIGDRSYDSESDEYDELEEDDDGEGDGDDDFDGGDSDMVKDDSTSHDDDVPNISKHAPTEYEHTEQQGGVKIAEETIQAPLPKVYKLLFGKDTEFMTQLLSKQKNKNVSTVPSFETRDGTLTREYNYVKPLSAPVGPKETLCQVTETIDHLDFEKYILCTQSTRTPDVPSGGSFSVVTYIYLSWSPKNSTKVSVFTYMNWTGKSWIRAAIDRGSIDGQKESVSIMMQELRSKLSSTSSPSVTNESDDSGATSSLPLIGPKTHPSANFTPSVPAPESIIMEDSLSTPLGTSYALCFDPQYLQQILSAQKSTDVSGLGPFPDSGTKKRTYTYTKPLNSPVGPKSTKCIVTETVEHFDLNSYIQVKRVVSTPDVPSGGSFHVSSNYWLSWGENNTTKLVISTGVVWTGKSWIKGVVEKGSIDGQKEGNVALMQELREIIAKDSASSSGKKSRKRGKSLKAKPEDELSRDALLAEIQRPRKGYNFTVPFVQDNPIGGMGLLFIFSLVLWFCIKWVMTPPGGSAIVLGGHGINKVVIGGTEYLVVPVVDDALKDRDYRMEQELNVWKWIESRTAGKDAAVDDTPLSLLNKNRLKEKLVKVKSAHKEQDLREMLKVAEAHLEEILDDLDKGRLDNEAAGTLL